MSKQNEATILAKAQKSVFKRQTMLNRALGLSWYEVRNGYLYLVEGANGAKRIGHPHFRTKKVTKRNIRLTAEHG